jgi:protocatechuate 3,4-dioxygenase beta subunit
MSFPGVLVLLLLSFTTAAAQAATLQPPPGGAGVQIPPRDNTAKTGTATLRGRIVEADSGQPLRKAQVRIFSQEVRENRMVTTDAQGRYEFKQLQAARYTITASKGSYVSLSYGQTRPFESGKPLKLEDGQTVEKVDFSLPRGSVIAGRIVDEFGEPMSDVQVAAQRYQYFQGRRRLTPTGRTTVTNDIGEFRVFGLAPGQYYLSATLRNMQLMTDSDDRSGYAPTYYPGTSDVQTAQKITLGLGQTIGDLAMTLMPTRTARVSGSAVDAQGRPLAGFIMMIQRSGSGFMGSGGGQIRPDGTFSIGGVAPGEYTLQANSGSGDSTDFAVADITVAGDDLSDVQLVSMRLVTVTGRIVIDPTDGLSFRPSLYRVGATPVQEMLMGGSPPGTLNDDLTFSVKTRPGLMRIWISSSAPDPGGPAFTQRAVRVNGVDIIDTGIEIKPNGDVTGIEIEMTNHVAELSGSVTNARGAAAKDYTVVVFPQDRDRWGVTGVRYMKSGRPDQDGRFKIAALPPGDYAAVAMDYVEPGESSDPEFLERVRMQATPFSIGEGEAKTLDLKLSTSS